MQYHFAGCDLDTGAHRLVRNGIEVPVEPQVFDLLMLLAQNPGKLLTKDQLIEDIWHGRIVSDVTISTRINAARAAVGDNGKDQFIIRTVPRRGYEMVASVQVEESKPRPATAPLRQTVRYTTSSDGTQIAWAVTGEGPPLMRAIHFLTHLEKDRKSPVMQPWLEDLSASFQLVRYDQRGTGLSQPDVSDLSLDAYADDMLAVADAAGLDRFPVFAASQGVPVTVRLAARYPERISRLVLYGGYALGRSMRGDAHFQEQAEAMKTLMRSGWAKADSPFMSSFISLFCPESSREEQRSLVDMQLASTSVETAIHIRDEFDRIDIREDLQKITVPTLVLHASGDAAHPVSQGRQLAARIKGAEFRLIESNNHVFLKSTKAYDEVMAATFDFLAQEVV